MKPACPKYPANFVKQVNQALAVKVLPAHPQTMLLKNIGNLDSVIPLVSTKGFNPNGGQVMLGIFHYDDLDEINNQYPVVPGPPPPLSISPRTWGKKTQVKQNRVLNETFQYTGIIDGALVGASRGAFGGGYSTHHFAGEMVIGQDPYFEEPEAERQEETKENLEDWLKTLGSYTKKL